MGGVALKPDRGSFSVRTDFYRAALQYTGIQGFRGACPLLVLHHDSDEEGEVLRDCLVLYKWDGIQQISVGIAFTKQYTGSALDEMGGVRERMRCNSKCTRRRLAELVNLFKEGGQVISRRVMVREMFCLCGTDADTSILYKDAFLGSSHIRR